MNRGKKLAANTITSLTFQITTIVCGFVLPRLILQSFGSDVNGLVNSITQFLSLIAFLELGVGSVVQSSLYKPLSQNDNNEISKIVVSAQKFFRRIALILLCYIIVLIIVYPLLVKQDFGWIYTAALIASISISSFAQYYFGVVDRLLLTANQRGYIQYTAQTATLLLNTAACVILIHAGATIHIVKLTTSLIYLARPLFLRLYINKHYKLDRKIKYSGEPIKQKWNGIAQHVASVVLDNTDTVVLTLFSTLSNVSIYSVYHTVIYGVKQLFLSTTNGIHALLGELWAKKEKETLAQTFSWFEWILHTGTVFIFGCTGILVLPFVSVYTDGINDAQYIQPLFAALITIAHAGHCLRLPYNVMILVAGHYKQTQHNYIIAAVINIVVSVVAVSSFGLVGVAIGTLAAMTYQTIWMAWYNSQNLVRGTFKSFICQIAVDTITVLIGVIATIWIPLCSNSIIAWAVMAVEVALIWVIVIVVINFIFYREKSFKLALKVKGVIMNMINVVKGGAAEVIKLCWNINFNGKQVFVYAC
ncbi:MAG: sugar isomerase [Eubacterium sp.]|nr:sugar isomerase [Eubacterium sp.]MCC8173797.1 hypothetical protein [Odoribacter sp.]